MEQVKPKGQREIELLKQKSTFQRRLGRILLSVGIPMLGLGIYEGYNNVQNPGLTVLALADGGLLCGGVSMDRRSKDNDALATSMANRVVQNNELISCDSDETQTD